MSTVCASTLPPPRPSNHPVDVGLRSEAAVSRRLLERGYSVSIPLGSNQRYDLLVDVGELLRVQVKTGRLRGGAIEFNTVSVRSNTRKAHLRPYVGEIDFFAVYCPDTDGVYFIPIEEAGATRGYLRVAPSANNQRQGVRWAADYELPRPRRPTRADLHSGFAPE